MAKAKKPKKKQSFINRAKMRQNIGLLIVVAILVLIGAWFSYQALAKHLERKQFKQAETYVDRLHTALKQDLGQAENDEASKSCGYASRKEGQGPRGCGISFTLLYSAENTKTAQTLINKSEELIANSNKGELVSMGLKAPLLHEITQAHPFDETGSSYQEKNSSIQCSMRYLYTSDPRRLSDTKIHPTVGNKLQFSFSCGGSAKGEYYPVTKY